MCWYFFKHPHFSGIYTFQSLIFLSTLFKHRHFLSISIYFSRISTFPVLILFQVSVLSRFGTYEVSIIFKYQYFSNYQYFQVSILERIKGTINIFKVIRLFKCRYFQSSTVFKHQYFLSTSIFQVLKVSIIFKYQKYPYFSIIKNIYTFQVSKVPAYFFKVSILCADSWFFIFLFGFGIILVFMFELWLLNW